MVFDLEFDEDIIRALTRKGLDFLDDSLVLDCCQNQVERTTTEHGPQAYEFHFLPKMLRHV
jgi:hypothetical protein